jgi:tetratricopeptide (TPR) repeat protein
MSPAAAFEAEIANLSSKLAANPESRIFAPLADAYRRAGRISEAIEICREGLRHHPDYLSGRLVLARCHDDAGDLDAAEEAFGEVLRREPRNVVALRALGEIALARDDPEAAAARYEEALALEPQNAELRERLDALRRIRYAAPGRAPEVESAGAAAAGDGAPDQAVMRGDLAGAAGAPQATAAEAASEEIATVTLAEVYAEQGLRDRALGIYRRLLADDPRNPRLRERLEGLEREVEEERAQLDAEAGSVLGGYVPGELTLSEEDASTAKTVEGFSPAGADLGLRAETSGAASARAEASWAFLLVDEEDVDPDELFGGRSPAAGAEREGRPAMLPDLAGSGRERLSEPPARPARVEAPDAEPEREAARVPPVHDDDLRKFQEWLKSLK